MNSEEKLESFFICLEDHLKNIADYYKNYPAPGLITPVDALYIVFSDLKFAIERSRKGEFYNNNRLEDEKK